MIEDKRTLELLADQAKSLRRLSGLATIADMTDDERECALEEKLKTVSLHDVLKTTLGETFENDELWQAHISESRAKRQAEQTAVHDRTLVIKQ